MKPTKVKYLVLSKDAIRELLKENSGNVYNDIEKARADLAHERKEGQKWLFSIKQRGFSVKDKIDLVDYHLYKLEGVE